MYHVTFFVYAKHPLLVQPSLLIIWPFYNSKSFKPNGLASLFKRKNKIFFSTFKLSLELFILPV